jgi:hypothetical protein
MTEWEGMYEFEELHPDGKFHWDCADCGIVMINSKEDYDNYEPARGHIKGELKIND